MTNRLDLTDGAASQAGDRPAMTGASAALSGTAAPTASRVAAPRPGAPPPMPGGWLVSSGGETRLNDGEYVLGRDLRAEIRVHDLAVSRRHARISVAGEQVTIEDLGSKNGTWINGARLDGPRMLQDGDQLRVGGVQWVFTRNLQEAPTQAFLRSAAPTEADEEVI